MPLFNPGVGSGVQTSEIDTGAVTTAKIADGAVTRAKTTGVNSDPGTQIVDHSTTIGDYSAPSAAVATSTGTVTPTVTDDMTSYADQAAFDTAYPSTDTAKVRGDPTNDRINGTTVRDSSSDMIHHDFGAGVIHASKFIFDFDLVITSVSGAPYAWFGLSDSTIESNLAQDFIGLMLQPASATGAYRCGAVSTIAETPYTQYDAAMDEGQDLAVAGGNTYYIRIIRNSLTAYKVRVYSDSNRTTLLGTTLDGTITSGLDGLRYLKCFNFPSDSAAASMVWQLKNIKYYDNIDEMPLVTNVYDGVTTSYWKSSQEANPAIYVDTGSAQDLLAIAVYLHADTTETEIKIRASTDTSFDDTELLRTITVSNLTAGAWNYIRFNRPLVVKRYIQIYGSSGASKVLAISEIKYMTKTESQINRLGGYLPISSSDTSLGLSGA